MAKEKKGTQGNPIVINANNLSKAVAVLTDLLKKPFEINDAAIKDDFCHYGYEVATGKATGTIHNIKGKLIIENDLREAFLKFNVHAAVIDDVFKHSGIQIDDVDTFHNHELTFLYNTTKIIIKGKEENLGVILIGDKHVSIGSRMPFETPKIMLDNSSSYKWYNELKAAVDKAILEVELYDGGKGTPVKHEEEDNEKAKKAQTKMQFEQPAEAVNAAPATSAANVPNDEDFENAKV